MNSPTPRSVLFVVFIIVFLDMLGIGILIPVVPQLLGNPQSPFYLLPPGWTLQQGYILLGALITLFPLMQFLSTPILGELSDKFGRKPILTISLAGTWASYVLFAIGILLRNIPLLFLARSLDGITGGNISVAQAAISDTTPPEHRARSFGLIGAAFGLGFILGPYIGGKLSDPNLVSWFNASTPFWFAALLSAANILFVTARLPETHKSPRADRVIDWRKSARNIRRAWTLKPLRPIYLTNFLFQSGFSFFTTFFGVYLIYRFGFTQGNIGDFFGYIGLWIVSAQGLLVRPLSRRVSEPAILRVSYIAAAVCLLAYLVPSVWWGLLFVVPFFASFIGLSMANLTGLLSRSASARIQGEILGINASVQALAQSFPPLIAGVLASMTSPRTPILVASALVVCAGIVFNMFFEPIAHPVE